MKTFFLVAILCFTVPGVQAQKTAIYLHGRIVEVQGPEAFDSLNGFGAYQYHDILNALRQRGFRVISDVRPPDTDVALYAKKTKRTVDSLIAAGVAASDILIIGASKGGQIACELSKLLHNADINFVILGACSASGPLYGRILAVYESSDFVVTCKAFKESKTIALYREITLHTGLRHGFLYRPLEAWLTPACEWAGPRSK